MEYENLTRKTLWMRRRIIDLALKAGRNGAHIGGSLSCVEILAALYASIIERTGDKRDRVILSKGHAALALYASLEYDGVLTANETDTFETNGTHFYAHAPRNINKGLEFAGGSLSLGLSYAVGVALACKKYGYNNKVYAIVGDGECDEGLVWEAAMAASHYQLDNLVVIVDCNGLQLDGSIVEVMDQGSLADKFKAFGFSVTDVDGHDIKALTQSLSGRNHKPKAIIAHTIKGKGVSFCENAANWHHGVLNDKLYQQALAELESNPETYASHQI